MNFLTGEPWRVGLGPADGTAGSFEALVKLEPGDYSILELFGQVEKRTHRRFVWHREPGDTADGDGMLRRKVFAAGAHPGKYTLVHWKDGRQSLGTILDEALALMTEDGVALESPDHEVWVAAVTSRCIHLLMLPTPDVDDPLADPPHEAGPSTRPGQGRAQ